MSKSALLCIVLLIGASQAALGQTRTQCQRWADQHQNYTELRRAGGTLAEMDRWRDRQRSLEARLRAARCLQRFRISPTPR